MKDWKIILLLILNLFLVYRLAINSLSLGETENALKNCHKDLKTYETILVDIHDNYPEAWEHVYMVYSDSLDEVHEYEKFFNNE
jgi:hypothetical protein